MAKEQVTVRMDEDAKRELTDFCSQNGMSVNAAINKAMEILLVDNLKNKAPDQASCIEDFQAYMSQMLILYRSSIEHSILADVRAKADVKSQLEGMSTLAETNRKLQMDLEQAKSALTGCEAKISDLNNQLNRAKVELTHSTKDSNEIVALKEKLVELTQTNATLKEEYTEKLARLQEESFAKILEVVRASK